MQRDCSRRGYTTDQVLSELDRREPDSEAYIRPQRAHADIVVSFLPNASGDQEHLDAELVLRPTLKHPDFRSVLDGEAEDDDRASASARSTASCTCASPAGSTGDGRTRRSRR